MIFSHQHLFLFNYLIKFQEIFTPKAATRTNDC